MSRARSEWVSRDRGEVRLLRARLSFKYALPFPNADHADEGDDPGDHREGEEGAVADSGLPFWIAIDVVPSECDSD